MLEGTGLHKHIRALEAHDDARIRSQASRLTRGWSDLLGRVDAIGAAQFQAWEAAGHLVPLKRPPSASLSGLDPCAGRGARSERRLS